MRVKRFFHGNLTKYIVISIATLLCCYIWIVNVTHGNEQDHDKADDGKIDVQLRDDVKLPEKVPESDKKPNKVDHSVLVCTNEQRIQILHEQCEKYSNNRTSLLAHELVKIYNHIWVDEKHKILACLPPKSGCTTWKTILANNSGEEPIPKNFKVHMLHFGALKQFGILPLAAFNDSMKHLMLNSKDYFKFMVARHPLDRLYSGYVNKLVSGIDQIMIKNHGSRILNMFHPELDPQVRARGYGATFNEFVQYLKLPISNNKHWESIYNLCQPCFVQYDQVVKTETMDEDNFGIITKYLPHKRSIGFAGNVVAGGRQMSSMTTHGRKLEAYSGLNLTDMNYIHDRYKNDLEYFGYSYSMQPNENNFTLYSSCVNSFGGSMCC